LALLNLNVKVPHVKYIAFVLPWYFPGVTVMFPAFYAVQEWEEAS